MAIDVTKYNDEDLSWLLDQCRREYQRRYDLVSAKTTTPELGNALMEALGHVEGETWKRPLGSFDAYPKDWEVTSNGKSWVSLVDNNVWKPGESAWREKSEEGEIPEWIQPTGAHDSYNKGDRVTFEGSVYVSNIDANTWSPATYGWSLAA